MINLFSFLLLTGGQAQARQSECEADMSQFREIINNRNRGGAFVHNIHPVDSPANVSGQVAQKIGQNNVVVRETLDALLEVARREHGIVSAAHLHSPKDRVVLTLDMASDAAPASAIEHVHFIDRIDERVPRIEVEIFASYLLITSGTTDAKREGEKLVVQDLTGHGISLKIDLAGDQTTLESPMASARAFFGERRDPSAVKLLNAGKSVFHHIFPESPHLRLQTYNGTTVDLEIATLEP